MSADWVGQLLDLLTLAPEIQAALDRPPGGLPAGLTQKEVRRIARLGDHEAQRVLVAQRWPSLVHG